MNTKDLLAKVRALKELEMLIAEAESEMDAIKDEFKEELQTRNVEDIAVDVFKVRFKSVTSSRVDTTALKKELPEIAERFLKISTTRRFSIA